VSGSTVSVQQAAATTYGSAFDPWLDTAGTGLEQRGIDVAANGKLAAFEVEHWNGGTQDVGKIGVVAIQGIDVPPMTPAGVDCYLPTAGIARDVSLSMDATRIAWNDGEGLKVAGTPTDAADPCVLTGGPVVISPTGSHGSIGGADVAAFLPAAGPGGSAGGGGGGGAAGGGGATAPGGAPGAATLSVTVPGRVTTGGLARGVAVRVRVAGPGTVRVRATVPARRLGRRGTPVVVALGSRRATRAGKITVRLRLNSTGRRHAKRLKGARLTLRVAQGTLTSRRTITLR
jgi:hypothetical protein